MLTKNKKYLLLVLLIGMIAVLVAALMVLDKGYEIRTNGKLIIVNKGGFSVTIFDLEKGKQQAELFLDTEPHEITRLDNKDLVVVSNYGNEHKRGHTLTVINITTNKIERTVDLGENLMPHGLASIPHTNNVLVAVEGNNSLLEVNAITGTIEKKIATGQQQTHMVTLDPSATIAYAANVASGSISAIDIKKGELVQQIACGKGAVGIDVTPDGKEIWVSNSLENTVTVLAADTYRTLTTLPSKQEPLRLKISPNGKYCLVVNSQGGSISVFDVRTKQLIRTIIVPGKSNWLEKLLLHTPRLGGLLFSPDGKYAFVSNSNANKIIVIDTASWKIVSNISVGKIPDGLAIITDEKF